MWWDNPNDPEWLQRFKNSAFLDMPFKNETRDQAMQGVLILVCIGVVCWLGWIVVKTVLEVWRG